jgi:hypothetical protein
MEKIEKIEKNKTFCFFIDDFLSDDFSYLTCKEWKSHIIRIQVKQSHSVETIHDGQEPSKPNTINGAPGPRKA